MHPSFRYRSSLPRFDMEKNSLLELVISELKWCKYGISYGLHITAIDVKVVTRVCNDSALLQSMASHPETKINIVKEKMPIYIFPYMNSTENRIKHFDCLIGALVKIVFVVSEILTYEKGQQYRGTYPERFYAVPHVLAKTIDLLLAG